MDLALTVERIPTLTVEGKSLCIRVEISETEAVALYATLYRLLAHTPDPQPTPLKGTAR
jgi:hypothetical protein